LQVKKKLFSALEKNKNREKIILSTLKNNLEMKIITCKLALKNIYNIQ